MSVHVGFSLKENEQELFSAFAEVVPRVGERVRHCPPTYMSDNERAKWDPDTLSSLEALRGREFEVVRVIHEFRQSGQVMRPVTHLVWCDVVEVIE